MKIIALHITLIIAILLSLIPVNTDAQVGFSPRIDSIINLSTQQTMRKWDRELSGDTSTIIGGVSYTILSRHYNSVHNPKAAQFIYEQFLSFGLSARYMNYRTNGTNVIAVKTGIKYPNRQYIICAHYDDMPSGSLAPGADDNASGSCAVIEAARLLSPYTFDYTLVFVTFDEEELGLIGSKAYADSAWARGDSILGVINLDMIAYDSNNDYVLDIRTNSNSMDFSNYVKTVFNVYEDTLQPSVIVDLTQNSDHASFWNRNYRALCGIESAQDFNAYYHTVNDNFSHVNVPYFSNITKAAIAALMTFGWDYFINFTHTPLQSSNDTNARIATVVITSPNRISMLSNQPRLYYKINTGTYTYVNAFCNNLDTFQFQIPAEPFGTTVSYYIAAQDSLGNYVGTCPAGGKGLNPPGTIPPQNPFVYQIANIANLNQCSNTLPKPIIDYENTYDTITLTQSGIVMDVKVNLTIYHTYDGDISIYLKGPNATEIPLSTNNGGSGDNYVNTTFDDAAPIPITQGTAPFTGSYIPETPLSTFDNIPVEGDWILRVYDGYSADQGQLINWCILIQHSVISGIAKNEIPMRFSLSQNYPNPFNPSTKIDFSLAKASDVKIIVYDALGRVVTTLIDSKLNSGKYTALFNASEFASGIYFYTMFLDGNRFESKKMMLIK
jgi:subtilisin-like proprotein convertase family protein